MKNIILRGLLIFCSLFLFSCVALKSKQENVVVGPLIPSEVGAPILSDLKLAFESDLALIFEGEVVLNAYPNYLQVSFLRGDVFLNSKKTKNEDYFISSMDVGIGRKTLGAGGCWKAYNKTAELVLDEKIKSKTDAVKISNTTFNIFYSKPSDLKDSWIMISFYDGEGHVVYNHSQKLGHYFESYIENFEGEKYKNIPLEELIRKQLALEKLISYLKMKSYLENGRKGKSVAAIYKMKLPEVTENWKNNPEFSNYYLEYNKASEAFKEYRNNNSGFLANYELYKNKELTKEEYLESNRKIFEKLKELNPEKYKELSDRSSEKSRALWVKTGEFYLKKYMDNDELFPSQGIEDKYISSFIGSRFYKVLSKELEHIEKEIIDRI